MLFLPVLFFQVFLILDMNHDIFPFFEHVFVGENVVFENISISSGNIVDKLLTSLVCKAVRHLVTVYPVSAELLTLLLNGL
jgi:hypothetical protein